MKGKLEPLVYFGMFEVFSEGAWQAVKEVCAVAAVAEEGFRGVSPPVYRTRCWTTTPFGLH